MLIALALNLYFLYSTHINILWVMPWADNTRYGQIFFEMLQNLFQYGALQMWTASELSRYANPSHLKHFKMALGACCITALMLRGWRRGTLFRPISRSFWVLLSGEERTYQFLVPPGLNGPGNFTSRGIISYRNGNVIPESQDRIPIPQSLADLHQEVLPLLSWWCWYSVCRQLVTCS